MNKTKSVAAVVDDVLGPCLALDVDEHEGLGLGELDGDDGGEVAGGVAVGEVVGGESSPWGVVDGSNVFLISGVLTLAGNPDHLHVGEPIISKEQ